MIKTVKVSRRFSLFVKNSLKHHTEGAIPNSIKHLLVLCSIFSYFFVYLVRSKKRLTATFFWLFIRRLLCELGTLFFRFSFVFICISCDFYRLLNILGGKKTVSHRRTGRRQNFQIDVEKEKVQLKKEEERKQIYSRWSKGLKQIEEYKERVATETHEMSKPIARFEDDKDLEDYQRQQYRDGDPMAAYFRKRESESKSNPCK